VARFAPIVTLPAGTPQRIVRFCRPRCF